MTQPGDTEEAGRLEISVVAQLRGFAAELRRGVNRAAALIRAVIDTRANTSPFLSEAYAAAQTVSRTTRATIRVDADTNPARTAINGLLSALRTAGGVLTRTVLIGGIVSGLSVLVTWLAASAANLLAFAGAVIPAWQALGILPAALTTVIGLFATLAVGVQGVGDALKETFSAYATLAAGGKLSAAEQERLAEALERLSPAARDFVLRISELAPAFTQLRLDVQERLFNGLGESVARLATSFLPELQIALTATAGVINYRLRRALEYIDTEATKNSFFRVLINGKELVDNLLSGLGPMLQIFLDISEVGGDILADSTMGFHLAAQAAAEFVRHAKETGQLREWIEEGLEVLKQLGRVIGNVASGVGAILEAANKAAGPGGALGALVAITGAFANWANSVEGQAALLNFFYALEDLGEQATPVFIALVNAIANGLAPAIASLVTGVAPALVSVLDILGRGLQEMAPAIGQLGAVFGEILRPIAVILVELLKSALPGLVVFAEAVADALYALVPAAEPVGRALGEIMRALAPLLPVIGKLAAVLLVGLAQSLAALAMLLAPVIELVSALASAFLDELLKALLESRALDQFAEMMRQVSAALRPLIPLVTAFAQQAARELIGAFEELQPLLFELTRTLISQLLRYLPQFIAAARPLVPLFFELAREVGGALLDAVRQLIPHIPTLFQAFLDLALALVPLSPMVAELAIVAVRQLLPAFLQLLPTIVQLIVSVTRLLTAFTEKGPSGYSLLDAFLLLIQLMLEANVKVGPLAFAFWALKTALDVVNGALNLINTLLGGVGSALRTVRDWVDRLASGLGSGLATALQVGRSLFDSLRGAAASLASSFWTIGRNIISSLISGLWSRAQDLWSTGKSIANGLASQVRAVFGIRSPSRLFREFGQQIGAGLRLGLEDSRSGLAATIENLAATLTGPFAMAPTATQAGHQTNIHLHGSHLTAEEQLEMLGARIAWEMRRAG